MRYILATVGAALVLAAPAHAEQWRAVAENESAPKTLMFVDQASLTRTGDTATAWVMTVLEDDTTGQRDWNHSVIYRQVDCTKKQSQMMHSKFYMNDRILEDDTSPGDWSPIREGSMIDGVADVMCGREDYLTDVIDDPFAVSQLYFKSGDSK